jgi:DNA invertase Pin-like site-specific DNA recombinase
MNRKAVIYSRVSTNEQTVENQLRVLREVAQVQREEMRDQGLMNSLKVLLRMNGILFWYGM